MRDAAIDGGAFGLRTTRFPHLTAQVLTEQHGLSPERAAVVASAVFTELGLKANEKTGNTAVAVFASERLPEQVAAAIATHNDEIVFTEEQPAEKSGRAKKKPARESGAQIPDHVLVAARAALDVDNTVDLALFGRMLAEIPGANVDGAVAVAHAFSVDPIALEPDFFTAVDDAAGEGEAAASRLDTTDLTAPSLYRYAELDRRQLRRNLAGAGNTETVEQLAQRAEAAFVEWFVRAMPTSKHRSTAAHTLPLLVVADSVRFAYSLADAFSPAITGEGVAAQAAARLLQHHRSGRDFTGSTAASALTINPTIAEGLDLTGFDRATTLADLIAQVQQ